MCVVLFFFDIDLESQAQFSPRVLQRSLLKKSRNSNCNSKRILSTNSWVVTLSPTYRIPDDYFRTRNARNKTNIFGSCWAAGLVECLVAIKTWPCRTHGRTGLVLPLHTSPSRWWSWIPVPVDHQPVYSRGDVIVIHSHKNVCRFLASW